jgi:hypothetical protein
MELYNQAATPGRIVAAIVRSVLSAATGFAIGTSFSWFAILISGTALAALSAAVLQIAGFEALSGIAIIAICSAVHQFAYVMGVADARRASKEAKKSRERRDKTDEASGWPHLH